MKMKTTMTLSVEFETILEIQKYAEKHKLKNTSVAVEKFIKRGLKEDELLDNDKTDNMKQEIVWTKDKRD